MKSLIVFALLVAAVAALPVQEAADQDVSSRTIDMSKLPSKSNLTSLIQYLVQLEVNKTIAALTAIQEVTGIGSKSPSAPVVAPPSESAARPFRFPYQQAWDTAAEYVRPVYSAYWMPYTQNDAGYQQLRMLKEQYPDVLDASGASGPSVTISFRNFLSLLNSSRKTGSDLPALG